MIAALQAKSRAHRPGIKPPKLNHKARIDLYDDLADALDDGEPLLEFLQKRQERYGMRGKATLARFFSVCADRHGRGATFAESLEGAVPSSDVMVIKAGEIAGTLPDSLRLLVKSIEDIAQMRQAIFVATIIPAISFFMLIGVVVMFHVQMAPMLMDVLPVEKWHPLGRTLYAVSSTLVGYWPVSITALGGLVYWAIWSPPNWTGALRFRVDRHFPYSVYRDYHGAVFLVTLASLLKAGVDIGRALGMLGDAGTPWVRRHIAIMKNRLDQDGDPYSALNTGILRDDVAFRVIDSGERSSFQEGIEKIGFRVVGDVSNKIAKAVAVLGVCSVIFVGLCLFFVIISFLLTTQGIDQATANF